MKKKGKRAGKTAFAQIKIPLNAEFIYLLGFTIKKIMVITRKIEQKIIVL